MRWCSRRRPARRPVTSRRMWIDVSQTPVTGHMTKFDPCDMERGYDPRLRLEWLEWKTHRYDNHDCEFPRAGATP